MQLTHQFCKNIPRFLNQTPKSLKRGWGRQARTLGVISCAGNIPGGDALTRGCGRHGEFQPLLQKFLTLHFPQNHQLNLACLQRVRDALLYFPLFHALSHQGSHHPLVTADSSHCQLGDCPAQETTSLRWEGAECAHGVARGSPTPLSPCPPTRSSARLVFPHGDRSVHVQAVTPKATRPLGWALGWFGHKPWPAKGLGMQLWEG